MPRTIQADGRTITVPDDATPDEVNQIVGPAPTGRTSSSTASSDYDPNNPMDILRHPIHSFNDAFHPADVAKGVAKGLLNAPTQLGSLIHKIPGGVGEALIPSSGLEAEKSYGKPSNTAQSIGKGVEQAGEFMLPGLGEEAAGAKLTSLAAEHAPQLIKAAPTVAKLGVQALGSGAVNKVQGGSFAGGAASGGLGAGAGEALKAAAPAITEIAQGLRTPGRTAGKAILDETSGVLPNTIRQSAADAKNKIGSELGDVMQNASKAPTRRLLQAPTYDVPLHASPDVAGTPSRPITLHQPDRPMRLGLPSPSGDVPMAPGMQEEFPERLASGTSSVRLDPPAGTHPGMGAGDYFGEVPGERGGAGEAQGTFRTRDPNIHGQAAPSGPEMPYRGISLSPFRSMAADEAGKANLQGNVKLAKGIGKVNENTLLNRGLGGPRPETVSPYEFWNTKRGVGDAVSATKWRPGYNDPFTGFQKRLYGSMADTLHEAVPESVPLDRRYSALVPAAKEGARPLLGHALGAGGGAVMGGYAGGREGGLTGALKGAAEGGLMGSAAPALLNTGARMAWSPVLRRMVPLAVGGALQQTRDGQ